MCFGRFYVLFSHYTYDTIVLYSIYDVTAVCLFNTNTWLGSASGAPYSGVHKFLRS